MRDSPAVSTEQPCENPLESPGLKREWTNLKENNDDSERRKPIRFPSAPSSIFPTTLSNENIQKTRETVAGGVPTVLSLLPFSQADAQTPDMNPWLFTTANGTMAYFSPLPSSNGNFQSTLREYQTLPIRCVSVDETLGFLAHVPRNCRPFGLWHGIFRSSGAFCRSQSPVTPVLGGKFPVLHRRYRCLRTRCCRFTHERLSKHCGKEINTGRQLRKNELSIFGNGFVVRFL